MAKHESETRTYAGIEHGDRWAISPDIDALGDGGFRLVRPQLGLTAFGMNVKLMRPGSSSKRHWHVEQQEVIFVHQGEIEVSFGDGVTRRVGTGGIVRIDAGESHAVTVPEDAGEPAVLVLMGGKDGIVDGDAVFAPE